MHIYNNLNIGNSHTASNKYTHKRGNWRHFNKENIYKSVRKINRNQLRIVKHSDVAKEKKLYLYRWGGKIDQCSPHTEDF